MNESTIKMFTSNKEATITEAMKKIDNNASGTLFIVDDESTLLGAVSDGDIRRSLIETGDLSVNIGLIMNRNPVYIKNASRANVENIFSKKHIHALPVVDDELHIIDVLVENRGDVSLVSLGSASLKDVPIVIMAGGKGTRLYPYTKILPKPLIPINDIPIMERIINEFRRFNADNIYISVNYKREMIKSYFKELDCDYDIKYIEECTPLGTAGSLKLIYSEVSGPIIVTNCDILIKADYMEVLDFHRKSGNAITVVSAMMDYTIPYGVIKTKESGKIVSMEEKPTIPYVVNTGMYVVDSKYLSEIPDNQMYHMPDLIRTLMSQNIPVGIYPIGADSFLDMGEFVEMQRMEDKLKESLV